MKTAQLYSIAQVCVGDHRYLRIAVIFLLICSAGHGSAKDDGPPFWPLAVKSPRLGNGIHVGDIKVFDDRSLTLMAESLSATLAQMNALDASKVMQNLGTLQGSQQSAVSRAFSISTLPIPGVQTTEQFNTNLNQLLVQQRVTSNAAFSPTIPSLPASAFAAPTAPSYSEASADLLTDEMNISYQLLNLRLLLERALSDRIILQGQNGPRVQALLGFSLNIDPLRQHKGKAAVVEIELTGPGTNAPKLVSLMPQAKTYNVAALSQKAFAFGASAVVKVVTLGYSEQHQGQTYFLYRDADTVALERPCAPNKLRFAWEFRPVLNRTAVEAGWRQLFAVVSLDQPDDFLTGTNISLQAKVTTYWASYDKANAVLTSGPYELRSPALIPVIIPSSKSVNEALSPKVKSVFFTAVGASNVVINITGDNFYPGTDVLLGDRIASAAEGSLTIKDPHVMQVYATISDLAKGHVAVRGRYGLSTEALDTHVTPAAFKIGTRSLAPGFAKNNHVTLQFKNVVGTNMPNVQGKTLLLSIGTQFLLVPPDAWVQNTTNICLDVSIFIDKANLESNVLVTASFPFTTTPKSSFTIYNPATVDAVSIVAATTNSQKWAISGTGFDSVNVPQIQILADTLHSTTLSNLEVYGLNTLLIDVPAAQVGSISNIVVQTPGTSFRLSAPKYAAPDKMTFSAVIPTVPVGSAGTADFTGSHFEQITNISFCSTNLVFMQESQGTKLHVFLSRDVTAKAGPVALPVRTKEGETQIANIIVQ